GADASGVAAEKVECGSFFGKNRNRGQHAGYIAGQEDHDLGLAASVFQDPLGYMLERVAAASVLAEAGVVVIGATAFRDDDDDLDDRTEADRVPDNGFVFLRVIDGFGVAATFDVEYRALGPAVLVIADQVAARVCRQCGLAGAGQAEEQTGIAGIAD